MEKEIFLKCFFLQCKKNFSLFVLEFSEISPKNRQTSKLCYKHYMAKSLPIATVSVKETRTSDYKTL